MKETAIDLLETIQLALPLLHAIGDVTASSKPAPGKWSPKEVIGHLIDSAGNNQQKFVRCMAKDGVAFANYAQDYWVAAQHYNAEPWGQLVQLWATFNVHLAHMISNIPEELLCHTVTIENSGAFTLEFIVKDYPEHLKHHLKSMFPDEEFLDNSFRMVY